MMMRVVYQKARDAIRTAGDDIARARQILTTQVKASQAIREEVLEIGIERALTYALQDERKAARDGRQIMAMPTRSAQKDDGDEGLQKDEAHASAAPAPSSSESEAEEPGTIRLMEPNLAMSPVPSAPTRSEKAYRNVARIYSGMLGYRLHTAPNRVVGEANRDDIRREVEHMARKLATEDAYLGFLAEVRKMVEGGGTVGDHLTADAAQTLYDAQRKAFGERVQRYLSAGAK